MAISVRMARKEDMQNVLDMIQVRFVYLQSMKGQKHRTFKKSKAKSFCWYVPAAWSSIQVLIFLFQFLKEMANLHQKPNAPQLKPEGNAYLNAERITRTESCFNTQSHLFFERFNPRRWLWRIFEWCGTGIFLFHRGTHGKQQPTVAKFRVSRICQN